MITGAHYQYVHVTNDSYNSSNLNTISYNPSTGIVTFYGVGWNSSSNYGSDYRYVKYIPYLYFIE